MKPIHRTLSLSTLLMILLGVMTLSFPLPVTSAPQGTLPPIEPIALFSGGVAVLPEQLALGFSWVDGSNNETGFRLEQKQGVGGGFSVVATIGANITSFGGIYVPRDGNTYIFRVRAFNSVGESASSNEVAIDTDTASAVPPPDPGDDPEPVGDPFSDVLLEVGTGGCTGGIFGTATLFPGDRCCYSQFFNTGAISFEITVRSNIVGASPKAKIKIFRDGVRVARTGLFGPALFSFPDGGTHSYKVCASYPLANTVNGSPADRMFVENIIH